MDTIISKGAGKMKQISARLGGLVGVFRTLAEQHSEVAVLLKRLQTRPERRSELWPDIRRELLSHERGELRAVYPVLREHVELEPLVDHHDLEASELDALIETLDTFDAENTQWQPLFDRLVDSVLQHAQEEEQEIFPKAQQVIGDKLARELEANLVRAKKNAANAV